MKRAFDPVLYPVRMERIAARGLWLAADCLGDFERGHYRLADSQARLEPGDRQLRAFSRRCGTDYRGLAAEHGRVRAGRNAERENPAGNPGSRLWSDDDGGDGGRRGAGDVPSLADGN